MRKGKILAIAAILAAALGLSGCSRSQLNYQIAECIGTLGMYENGEPVETPKMKAARETKESEAALEASRTSALDAAARLALSYEYEAAISYIEDQEVLRDDERAATAIELYQKQMDNMYEFEGTIPHLCFTNLVVDTARAFDGDEYSSVYKSNMITLTEFNNILNSLHESGYVLIDLHSLVQENANGKDVLMSEVHPILPNGKKPIIFSVENLDYSSIRNGDGVATKLTLDKEGNVGALYTDDGGHDLIGAYDVVPALEAYIEEHPDFSYHGARGIIGVSGTNGIFGYQVEENDTDSWKENQDKVKQIVAKLKKDGWTFASQGYSYQYMSDMSYDNLRQDILGWKDVIGNLVGECDTLLYPYGSEVDYTTEKAAFLINQGLRYMVGMWSEGDHMEVNTTYLRQTRRTITGYVLTNYPDNFRTYFSATAIMDPERK